MRKHSRASRFGKSARRRFHSTLRAVRAFTGPGNCIRSNPVQLRRIETEWTTPAPAIFTFDSAARIDHAPATFGSHKVVSGEGHDNSQTWFPRTGSGLARDGRLGAGAIRVRGRACFHRHQSAGAEHWRRIASQLSRHRPGLWRLLRRWLLRRLLRWRLLRARVGVLRAAAGLLRQLLLLRAVSLALSFARQLPRLRSGLRPWLPSQRLVP